MYLVVSIVYKNDFYFAYGIDGVTHSVTFRGDKSLVFPKGCNNEEKAPFSDNLISRLVLRVRF